MKSIIKLRLINWHYFVNTTTDIRNLTFLTGPNGAGKSTIIDAIQILIEGTTNPSNFNKAANEKGRSGRSLLGYLKGEIGIENDGSIISVRKGNFTSYIAMEIEDDVEKKIFTIGAMFDVDNKNAISKHYFFIDSPFPKCDFQISVDGNNRPMQYKEFSSYLRSNNKSVAFKFFDTDIDYHNFTKEAFGNLPDKYFTLFKQAVSFAPISDLSKFITDYVCDADTNVDIEPMQKTIHQYKILETEAKVLKERQDQLERINNLYKTYKENDAQLRVYNYLDKRLGYEGAKKKKDNALKKIEELKNKINSLNSEIYAFDEQIADFNSSISSYEAKKYQSDNYQLSEAISNKKKDYTQKITSIQMQISTVVKKLKDYAENYYSNCSSFLKYYEGIDSNKFDDVAKDFDELKDIAREVSNNASIILNQITSDSLNFTSISTFRDCMDHLHRKAISLYTLVQSKLSVFSDKLILLQKQIDNLSAGKKPYDSVLGSFYTPFKEQFENALKNRHTDAYVHIFADLIDINDDTWTTAIEAAIYGQKFNFFVNPEYYEEAFSIFKELRIQFLNSGYGFRNSLSVVDSSRLIEAGFSYNENSVASLIDTNDEAARAYTNFLLGKIKKCYTFSEARYSETGAGLLPDCTGYRGFASWNLDERSGRQHFIGTRVSTDNQSFLTKQFSDTRATQALYSELLTQLNKLTNLPVMSIEECNSYRENFDKVSSISDYEVKIKELDEQMHDAAYGNIGDINDKIDSIASDKKKINQERDTALTSIGDTRNELSHLEKEVLPQAESEMKVFKDELDKYDPKLINDKYDPAFNKLSEQLSLSQIKERLSKEYTPLNKETNNISISLTNEKKDYCNKYHQNYRTDLGDDNSEYFKSYEEISQVTLPDYESKIVQAHEDSIKEFKDDFIYKLRGTIESVYSQINDLNKALEENNFGRDKYQFQVTANRDYKVYYDMIMDADLLKHGDAESMFMEKYKTTMNDLFMMISDSNDKTGAEREQINRNIALYTNYTTYLNFDLLVKRGLTDDAKWISLGKSFKSQSGGETQNPFYIAIIASFASVTRVNNPKDSNTLRLVIFDEAFSKMDSARIMKSTELLKQFKLQCILSTPSEKLRDLVDYVDLILVTIHSDKSKKSSLDTFSDKFKEDKFKLEEEKMLTLKEVKNREDISEIEEDDNDLKDNE